MDQWHLPAGSEVSGQAWYTGRHVLLEKGNVFKSFRSPATKNKLMSLKLTPFLHHGIFKLRERYLLSGKDTGNEAYMVHFKWLDFPWILICCVVCKLGNCFLIMIALRHMKHFMESIRLFLCNRSHICKPLAIPFQWRLVKHNNSVNTQLFLQKPRRTQDVSPAQVSLKYHDRTTAMVQQQML